MQITFEHLAGERAGTTEVVRKSRVLIGRDAHADLRFASPTVSNRHAEMVFTDDGIVLRDLGSRDGTYLDGQPVSQPVWVFEGSVIALADGPQLRVRLGGATPGGTRPLQPGVKETRPIGSPGAYDTTMPTRAAASANATVPVRGTLPGGDEYGGSEYGANATVPVDQAQVQALLRPGSAAKLGAATTAPVVGAGGRQAPQVTAPPPPSAPPPGAYGAPPPAAPRPMAPTIATQTAHPGGTPPGAESGSPGGGMGSFVAIAIVGAILALGGIIAVIWVAFG